MGPSVADLVQQLRVFLGYRSLWIEPTGLVMHTEPDDELEKEGYRYVATLMQPGPEELAEALVKAGVVLTQPVPSEAANDAWIGVIEAITA